MLKKKKNATLSSSNIYIEPIIFLSDDAPNKLEEFVSDLITMRGIIKLSLIGINTGKLLYNYERWGKSEKTMTIKNIISLIETITKQLQKLDKKTIDHLILRSDNMNLIIFSVNSKLLFLQCDNKVKLPLVTIKARRIVSQLAEL